MIVRIKFNYVANSFAFSKSFNLDDKYIQCILGINYNYIKEYLINSQFMTVNYILINALTLEKNALSILFIFKLINLLDSEEDYELLVKQPIQTMSHKLDIGK